MKIVELKLLEIEGTIGEKIGSMKKEVKKNLEVSQEKITQHAANSVDIKMEEFGR
jgi:hypothetical protein